MISLKTNNIVDNDLKVIKSDDVNTSLSLSNEGNGARIDGNLDVTGSYKGPVTIDGGVIQSDSNIEIKGDLNIDGNSLDTSGSFTLLPGGNFTIDSAGDITLDSATGAFPLKNNGTQFIPDIYAGMILGYTRISNNSTTTGHNVISIDTNMTVLETAQGTECKVTFVAPPSGNVEIQFHAAFNTQDTYYLSVSTAASYAEHDETHTYDFICIKNDETDVSLHTVSFAITGLTAGTTYNRWIAGKVASGAGDINHGRNRSAGTHAPPIIIKAIALPAIITTGE